MSQISQGSVGLNISKSKRHLPNEVNIFAALVVIIIAFEVLGAIFIEQSFLFDSRGRYDSIFNEARLKIIILQVSIIGIIALGATQVILLGGIDLSSGSVVGAAAMIAMSFAQTELVGGNPNPKAIFGLWAMDLHVFFPIMAGVGFGAFIGMINGGLIAYTRIPPFIATLGMLLAGRGIALWWSDGQPLSFPTESYAFIGSGMMPVVWFLLLALIIGLMLKFTVYGKHTYAIGSNEDAARMSGINVRRHKVIVYMIAGLLAGFAATILSSKNLTAQTGMGQIYELYAIAMAVIGGVSLSGGRGSIMGTVIGAMIFGVIQSGFTFLKLQAYYQLMAYGAIIAGAVILDQWSQRRAALRS